jgi:CHASE3 domain sensor protein
MTEFSLAGSLSRRIMVLCGMVCAVLVLFAALLLDEAARMHSSLGWVAHSSEVLKTANQAMGHLRNAEGGARLPAQPGCRSGHAG